MAMANICIYIHIYSLIDAVTKQSNDTKLDQIKKINF